MQIVYCKGSLCDSAVLYTIICLIEIVGPRCAGHSIPHTPLPYHYQYHRHCILSCHRLDPHLCEQNVKYDASLTIVQQLFVEACSSVHIIKNMSTNSVEKSHPNARLCHILKWDHFDGYGFNLHAEKGKPGQYIGKVDEGSPAEAAGLRQGDRILEVNGESIGNKTHKQVVEAIKGLPNETKLLVIDPHEEGQDVHITDVTGNADKQVNNNAPKDAENGTLNLNMTAAELRAKLKERKKFDPKKEAIDFKKKFDIVQKL